MTATIRNPLQLSAWTRQATFATLACLLLPKCIACLHLYARLVATLFGTQLELCGPTASPWTAIAFDLAILAASFALIFATWQTRNLPLAACPRCHSS